MIGNGSRFPLPERSENRASQDFPLKPANLPIFAGDNKTKGEKAQEDATDAADKAPKVVDHSWVDKLNYDPPFIGRHKALDNSPELGRFREFADGVYLEDKMREEAEEREYHRANRVQVIDALCEIGDASISDTDRKLQLDEISTRIMPGTEDGEGDDEYLHQLMGIAKDASKKGRVFSGRTASECRKKANRIRRAAAMSRRPNEVIIHPHCRLSVDEVRNIYRIPVISVEQAAKGTKSRKQSPVLKPTHASEEAPQVFAARGMPEEIPDPSEPKEPGKENWSNLHNMIFACIARRNYECLRSMNSTGHRLASTIGGPVAYRRAVLEVLARMPGLHLHGEDLGLNPDRPVLASIKQAFGINKVPNSQLALALPNCIFVFDDQPNPRISVELQAMGVKNISVVERDEDCCGKQAGFGERDFSPVGKTVGLVDRTIQDYYGESKVPDNANPDHDKAYAAPGPENVFGQHSKDFKPIPREAAGTTQKSPSKADPFGIKDEADDQMVDPTKVLPLENFDFADPSGASPFGQV